MDNITHKGDTYMVDSATVDTKYTVTLPDFDDADAMATLMVHLSNNQDKRGVKKLLGMLTRREDHIELAHSFAERAHKTAGYINGHRQPISSTNKLARAAQKFYTALSTPALRLQCKLYNLDYDSFDSQEDIIAALVEKNVKSGNGKVSE